MPDSVALGAAKKYINPIISGDRLVQDQGFAKASAFAMASNIGAVAPTRLIGTGAVCDQDFCDDFKWLVCQK